MSMTFSDARPTRVVFQAVGIEFAVKDGAVDVSWPADLPVSAAAAAFLAEVRRIASEIVS
jgi:hypothetical protein